jgi:hypothetical protein
MHGRKLAFICVQEASASLTNLNYEDLKKGAVEK